jgi:sarcosine oxidase subunit alpha
MPSISVRSRRLEVISDRVTMLVDGERVAAQRGEPVAVALAAHGRGVLARSVKYHRPRGASCYAGRCDGCLMRVNGLPNVMTCRVEADDGLVIETQNVVGTAERDLLAVTDWFFPDGMDHHHMFTRFKALNQVMQKVARRVAGIGTLPEEVVEPIAPRDASSDVLVIGGGPAGLAAAIALCHGHDLDVHVVEEETEIGGHALYGRDAAAVAPLVERARRRGIEIATRTAAVAAYPDEASDGIPLVLLKDAAGVVRHRARAVVFATGLHEGASAIENNDTPGVMGVHAAERLLRHRVLPGLVIAIEGDDERTRELAARLTGFATIDGPHPAGSITKVDGRPTVRRASIGEREVKCDAVVIRGPLSGAFEVGAQAGLEVEARDGAFLLASGSGRVRATGEVCTGPCSLDAIVSGAARVGAEVAAELAR